MIRIFLCIGMVLATYQVQCAQIVDIQTKQLSKLDKKLYNAVLGADRGNLTKILKLLEKGANPDAEVEDKTILMHAFAKDIEPIQNCCFAGPEPRKDIHILEKLLKKSSNLNFKNHKGETALLLAILMQDMGRLKIIVAAGAELNDSFNNIHGKTAVIQASLLENYEILRLLIKAGAQFDSEYLGLSPLEIVAEQNDMRSVLLLLNAGAIPRPYFCQLAQEDTRFSRKQNLKEALQHCQQRLSEYTQKCIASISAGSDLLPELVKLIAEYTISAAPARVPTETEMQAIQPILDEIAASKQFVFDIASKKIDVVLEKLEKEKSSRNSMQLSCIEDALDEYNLAVEKIEQQQDNANCVVM